MDEIEEIMDDETLSEWPDDIDPVTEVNEIIETLKRYIKLDNRSGRYHDLSKVYIDIGIPRSSCTSSKKTYIGVFSYNGGNIRTLDITNKVLFLDPLIVMDTDTARLYASAIANELSTRPEISYTCSPNPSMRGGAGFYITPNKETLLND